MNPATQKCLASLKLGEPQVHRDIVIFPLIHPPNGPCNWLTLSEALQARQLTITETSEGGSVPELKALNQSDRPILLLDGEELMGAKQNRVLNTTILLREKSETTIPVSCTERGRWSYSSAAFAASGAVMSPKIRSYKSKSVSASLEASEQFGSGRLSRRDLRNPASLAAKLARSSDPLSAYIHSRLSDETRRNLDSWQQASGPVPFPLQAALVDEINAIVGGPPMWDEQRFSRVNLRAEARELLARKPQGPDLVRLHRLLLEDAYPMELPRSGANFQSNQGEVWNKISELQACAKAPSPTGAMHDVYKAWEKNLDAGLMAFPVVPGQTGLLAVIGGELAGFDLIPDSGTYGRLHAKLVKSYVLDALTSRKSQGRGADSFAVDATAFLQSAVDCTERTFPSIGYGTDCRYESPGIAGAALVHEDRVVHAAFFKLPGAESRSQDNLAALRRRRSWASGVAGQPTPSTS